MKCKKMLMLTFISTSLCLVACGNDAVTPKSIVLRVLDNYKGECEINTPIDVGYFFYCSDTKAKVVTVTYNKGYGDIVETVNGEIFIPSCSGRHVFTCTAGGQSVSKEVIVLDQKPFISVDTSTYFHVVEEDYREVYLDDLTQNISCTISPKTAYLRLDKVEYAPFNLKIDKGEAQFTEVPFTNDHFTAEKLGHYKVHVSSVNGSRSAPGMFNVIVDTNSNNGNEFVKKLSPTSKKYCSNKVVVDSSNPNAFLLPAADWKKGASFVTLKDEIEYTDIKSGKATPQEVVIKFKGKNIPTIGLYTEPDPTSGSFSNTAISAGYLISWEQNNMKDRYTVTHGTATFLWKTVYSNHPEYELGIQDLDDNTFYRLKLGLKTTENKYQTYTHLHSVGWTIEKIVNYGQPNESYEKLSTRDYYLPYEAGGWWDNFSDAKGYVTFYSSSLQDITFEVVRD